jgi:hypothetical protein
MSSSLANDLHETLKNVENDVGTEKIQPDRKEIEKFCSIIGDSNTLYFEKGLFPPGYIMNLTNRVIQKFFIEIGPMFISKIRGLIHVGSKVEFRKPMSFDKSYVIKVETSEPVEKKGKQGTYYSIIFKTVITDEDDEIHAVDLHDFFFKL